MTSDKRAIDKIFHRRDRYDIPEWQREEVWGREKKQNLIDTILRGWKLPKFYFVKSSEEDYLVEDGQQRLTAIWEFFSNELPLTRESAKRFGGRFYKDLPRKTADLFDDFEIEFDVIEEATDAELKDFFQRLQEGMPLNSSEKLNAVDSKLRDFCSSTSKHPFFRKTVAIPNTRYAHFDVLAKAMTVQIEGTDAALRFEDMKRVFEAQAAFATTSAVAKRMKAALDFLHRTFRHKGSSLRTRTIVQSLITLTAKLVETGRAQGLEPELRKFFDTFMAELAEQVEMGQSATDRDYVTFQRSVNANVRGGAKTRQEIMLRKLFRVAPKLADAFDPSIIAESGLSAHISVLGDSIVHLIDQINNAEAAKTGEDLFKATNKTAQALIRIRKPAKDLATYEALIDDLYFLFRESVGARLSGAWPTSFAHVNDLRTDLRHDVDHGDAGTVRAKRRKAGATFKLYAGGATPDTIEPARFPLIQSNLLEAVDADLRALLLQKTK